MATESSGVLPRKMSPACFSVFSFYFQVNFGKEPRLVFLGKLFIHLPTLKLKVTAYMKSVTYNNEFDFSLIFKGQPLIFPIEDIWNSLLTAPWGKICVVLLRGAQNQTKLHSVSTSSYVYLSLEHLLSQHFRFSLKILVTETASLGFHIIYLFA